MEQSRGELRLASTRAGWILAVAFVGLALGLTTLLQNIVSTTGYLFFYIAVVAASWFGGKWGGGIAVILSTLTVDYFFLPPIHSFSMRPEAIPLFIEFSVSAIVVGWFSSWRKEAETELRRARDELQMRVEERTAELRQSNEQLVAEMAERKRAQEAYSEAQAELARVSRVSALGALAASISHEVNQPLAAVVTNADACAAWLSNEPPDIEEARATLECIAREGTRASDVVRRIRAMFSKGAPERTEVDINDLIREIAALMQTEALKHQVVLETDMANNLAAVLADRVQLQQVIVNLAMNGLEAMSAVSNRPRRLLVRTAMQGADILVAVSDSGPGIDPANVKRIFDAFFTTKTHGMGMGLSISHSIIDSHGGRLWATRNDDHGATFQFTLPRATEIES